MKLDVGGLSCWQINLVNAHIDAHIDSPIYIEQLAALARLSFYRFCRVFRNTFGTPPHRYVMHRRIERSKELMLTTDVPLGQIAAECGMADQAHLSKVFRRIVGESPGAWRRARAPAAANAPT
jgi:AraC family transcriptional regulator